MLQLPFLYFFRDDIIIFICGVLKIHLIIGVNSEERYLQIHEGPVMKWNIRFVVLQCAPVAIHKVTVIMSYKSQFRVEQALHSEAERAKSIFMRLLRTWYFIYFRMNIFLMTDLP